MDFLHIGERSHAHMNCDSLNHVLIDLSLILIILSTYFHIKGRIGQGETLGLAG